MSDTTEWIDIWATLEKAGVVGPTTPLWIEGRRESIHMHADGTITIKWDDEIVYEGLPVLVSTPVRRHDYIASFDTDAATGGQDG